MKKGTVEAQPSIHAKDGLIRCDGERVRSLTIINAGTSIIYLFGSIVRLPIAPTASITLGGYDDSNRSDDIEIEFQTGAFTNKAVVLKDVEINKPKFN